MRRVSSRCLSLVPCPPTGPGRPQRGERLVLVSGVPFSAVGVIPGVVRHPGVQRSSDLLLRGLVPFISVGRVSRESGDLCRVIRAGRNSNMTGRMSMGGGIVSLLFRTPDGSSILVLC